MYTHRLIHPHPYIHTHTCTHMHILDYLLLQIEHHKSEFAAFTRLSAFGRFPCFPPVLSASMRTFSLRKGPLGSYNRGLPVTREQRQQHFKPAFLRDIKRHLYSAAFPEHCGQWFGVASNWSSKTVEISSKVR